MKIRTILGLAVLPLVLSLGGCGGGGGGSSSSTSGSSATSFTAGASVGELVTYTVDTTALTYSYEIIGSAYGKEGTRGSGTLTRNSDGTYTPNGIDGRIRLNANGTMIGVVHEDFDGNGVDETVPVFGVSNPVTSFSAAAGTYNFVDYRCNMSGRNYCEVNYGTYTVASDGTWTACARGDGNSDACDQTDTGSFNNLGGGKFQIIDDEGIATGTLVAHTDTSRNQKVMFMDIADSRTTVASWGKGLIVGSEKIAGSTADGNGTWVYMNSRSGPGTLSVTNTSYIDGNYPGALTYNTPWSGFATTGAGTKAILAGTGLFAAVYEGNTSHISIGLRLD